MVIFFDKRPTTLAEIEMLDWERPANIPESMPLFGPTTPTNSTEPKSRP
jgi:hypothetical protein